MKKWIMIAIILLALINQAMAAPTTLSVADSKGAKGDRVKVPINVAGASNLGAMDIVLMYDRNVLKGIEAEGGALASNAMVASKEIKQERLKISFADSGSISGDGTIVLLSFLHLWSLAGLPLKAIAQMSE